MLALIATNRSRHLRLQRSPQEGDEEAALKKITAAQRKRGTEFTVVGLGATLLGQELYCQLFVELPRCLVARHLSLVPGGGGELAERKNVLVTAHDVTVDSSIVAAVKKAEERFGAIDVLVNNAGFGVYGLLEATSVESIRKQFETNVVGLLATTRAVLPMMRKMRSGVVVNVASIAGKTTYPLGTMYNGTKFAVEGISEALRFELRKIGVLVELIEPGIAYTNFFNASTMTCRCWSIRDYAEVRRSDGRDYQAWNGSRRRGGDDL